MEEGHALFALETVAFVVQMDGVQGLKSGLLYSLT